MKKPSRNGMPWTPKEEKPLKEIIEKYAEDEDFDDLVKRAKKIIGKDRSEGAIEGRI